MNAAGCQTAVLSDPALGLVPIVTELSGCS
jgi:hypothetical protein